jgi:hypothetical protein
MKQSDLLVLASAIYTAPHTTAGGALVLVGVCLAFTIYYLVKEKRAKA